ncbi:MAG: acetylxylan esterase [Cyanosarcina radialis HA8281-LM2]|jgi:dienelactone hydrolase|nr:acetylxylan esterase [Cyanosarcina radialis HA8281-LM2]
MNRTSFLSLLGEMPTKSELNLKVFEERDCGSFVQQKIGYSSEAGETISAFLCIPKNINVPLSAIYCFHQHAANWALGKSEVVGFAGSPDQAYAKELAERGYITLAPDAICFEERADAADPVRYHAHQLHTRLMRGQTLLGKVLFDISAGIDLLQNLPQVDETRIGFIGHSYGGRTALFAPAFDRRIKVSVSNCGSTKLRTMLAQDIGIQFDYVVPSFLAWGDIEDVARLVEPCHLLILGTDDDKWSQDIEDICEYAKSAFVTGKLEWQIYSGRHSFSQEMRERAYRFLDRHLNERARSAR